MVCPLFEMLVSSFMFTINALIVQCNASKVPLPKAAPRLRPW